MIKGDGKSVVKGDGKSAVKGDGKSVMKGDCELVEKGDGKSVVNGDGKPVMKGDGKSVMKGNGELVEKGDGTSVVKGDGASVVKGACAGNEIPSGVRSEEKPAPLHAPATWLAFLASMYVVNLLGSAARNVLERLPEPDRGRSAESLHGGDRTV